MNSKTRLLRALPALEHLPRATLDVLASRCDLLTVDDGDHVCTAGGRASHCLVVADGEVRPSIAARFFDLDGLEMQEYWHVFPTTVVAVGPVTLLVIDGREVPAIRAAGTWSRRGAEVRTGNPAHGDVEFRT